MEFLLSLFEKFINSFHKPIFAVLVTFGLIGFFASIDDFISKLIAENANRFSSYGLIILTFIVFWAHHKFKLPRNEEQKIGVLISIFAEENEIEKKLKADFVEELKRSINAQGLSDIINVILVKNHIAENIQTPQQIKKLNKKVKAHYCVYGGIKKRSDGTNGDKYYLNLSGYVVHAPIDVNLSRKIGEEFSRALPREISFAENESFKGFKITSELVSISVKYIVGIAAFVSGDFLLSNRLHAALLAELSTHSGDDLWTIVQIEKSTKNLASDEEVMLARIELQKGDVEKARTFLQSALSKNNKNYGGYLVMAQVAFLHDKNIKQAFYFIQKARESCQGQMQWIYSLAFLFFWNNDFKKALKQCGKIIKNSYEGEDLTAEEVTQFNLNILKIDESKYQLYFWIGFVNYKKLNRLGDGLDYLEKYQSLSQRDASQSELQTRASEYIMEIKNTLGIA